MACEREVKSTEKVAKNKEEVTMEATQTQAGVLVLKQMPEFKAEAYNAETGHYTEVSSEELQREMDSNLFLSSRFYICMSN